MKIVSYHERPLARNDNAYVCPFVCIYNRPILGDSPKPHKFACEKRCAFHFLLCFSLKALCFSLHFSLKSTALFTFAALFTERTVLSLFTVLFTESIALFTFCCAFHFLLHFSLKSTALFTFHCAFHCTFHFLLHFSVKSTRTTDSTQISQFDLVFHRVQR